MVLILVLLGIVAVLVLGFIVVGLVFKLLWWALVGLAVGALARLLVPGRQELGLLATAGIGIVAGLLGGVIAAALDLGSVLQFVAAVGVAVALVVLVSGSRLARA